MACQTPREETAANSKQSKSLEDILSEECHQNQVSIIETCG